MPPKKRPIRERLLSHVTMEPNSGCWLWTAAVTRRGYGSIGVGYRSGVSTGAHRVAYEAFVGPIPIGMCVCHKCDVRSCINPDHLFLGTQKENIHDMVAKGRARKPNAEGVRCKHGHEFTPENTRYLRDGTRYCHECHLNADREFRRRRRAPTGDAVAA